MKAIRYTEFGSPDVLQLIDVEKPTPKENQVLVKIHAASLNPIDRHGMRGPLIIRIIKREFTKPKDSRIGTDFAGRVEAVGSAVTQFKVGDEVYGVCPGAFAEYAVAKETKIVHKPANISFESAAAVPIAAFTALQGLHDTGRIQAGQKVLIFGASGGVGTFAVQIAKALGAEVTAVCSSRHLDIMRSIGADHIIDYTREDFTKNEQEYDLILAVNGYRSIFDYQRALRPGGTYVVAGGALRHILQVLLLRAWIARTANKRMTFMGIAKTNQSDLLAINTWLENGKVNPVIDKCFPLNQTADAIRYLEEGHARGKIIITVAQ